MNFLELRKINYRPDGLEGGDLAISKQVSALKYADHLAFVTNTEISDWPIDPFRNAETKRFFIDRQDINEKFFEFKAERDKIPPELKTANLEQIKRIEGEVAKQVDRAILKQTRDYDSQMSTISEYCGTLRDLEIKAKTMAIGIKGLRLLKKNGVGLAEEVVKITAEGFWTFDEEVNYMSFLSKPIVLSYFNEREARDQSICLGRLRLTIVTEAGGYKTLITKYKDNNPSDFPHPHVHTDGRICFGELKAWATRHASQFELAKLVDCVKKVLCTYNEDDAYVHMTHFEESAERGYDAGDEDEEREEPDYEPEHDEDGGDDFA